MSGKARKVYLCRKGKSYPLQKFQLVPLALFPNTALTAMYNIVINQMKRSFIASLIIRGANKPEAAQLITRIRKSRLAPENAQMNVHVKGSYHPSVRQ